MVSYSNGKTCNRCGVLKPEDAYNRLRKQTAKGTYYTVLRSLCTPCHYAYNRELREKNRIPLSAKICPNCETEFIPSRRDKKYCSQSCCSKAEFARRPPYIKKPLTFHVIECEQCGDSFFNLTKHKRLCEVCKLENVRLAARERMRLLRADPILGPSIKADGWERLRLWQLANPEKVKAKNKVAKQRREHRKQQLPATLTLKEWEYALECFEYSCAYCGKQSDKLQQDHFIPLAKGGGYTKFNIIPACAECNQNKRAQDPFKWLSHDALVQTAAYIAHLCPLDTINRVHIKHGLEPVNP